MSSFQGSFMPPPGLQNQQPKLTAALIPEYLDHQRNPPGLITQVYIPSWAAEAWCWGWRQTTLEDEFTSGNFPLFAECVSAVTALMCVMSLLFSLSTVTVANSAVSSVFQPSLLPLLHSAVSFPLNMSFCLQSSRSSFRKGSFNYFMLNL